MRRRGSEWDVVSIEFITSMRMERWEAEFIERTGVRVVIGKGFMEVELLKHVESMDV